MAYYAHSALAVISSVLYQSLGPCVQEVWESCLGLYPSQEYIWLACALQNTICKEQAVKSKVFDAKAEGVLTKFYVSMEWESSRNDF